MVSPIKRKFHRLKIQITQRPLEKVYLPLLRGVDSKIGVIPRPDFCRDCGISQQFSLPPPSRGSLKADFFRALAQISLLFLVSCLLFTLSYAQSSQYIRVAIIKDVTSTQLNIKVPYDVIDINKGDILYKGRSLYNPIVLINGGIFSFGNIILRTKGIKIKPKKEGFIYVNRRPFRGQIVIIASGDSTFTIINYLDIEDYLKGVLYHEISHHWPREVIKAQTIVARTYALYEARLNKAKDYDLESTIYSQVYGGVNAERARTSRAIEETRNLYLIFQGDIFPAYYHATCGGYTEDASKLWSIDITPLKGVECRFCTNSPHYRWEVKLTLKEIEESLKGNGYNISRIKDIIVIERDTAGRVLKLKVLDDKSDVYISGKDFRQIFDPNLIRSTNFTIEINDSFVYLKGLGWGHGVGLCQWGAYFMAKQNYKYDEILSYYYPQAKVASFIANRQ